MSVADLARAELLGREAAKEGATRHNNPFHILREAKMHEAWERGRRAKPGLAELRAKLPEVVRAAKVARQKRADWLASTPDRNA